MHRLLRTSALVALAVFVVNASAQPPAGGPPQPMPPKADLKADKKVDPTDAAIAAALANDADVKMARAKIQLAEAELTKARQAVTLKVVTLRAKIDQFKSEFSSAQVHYERTARLVENARVSQVELALARDKLDAAKAGLALAEAELKLITGGTAAGATADGHVERLNKLLLLERPADATTLASLLGDYVHMKQTLAAAGPIPDRIRAALDKPVKIGAKGDKVTFPQALEAFKKDAGLDVPVRGTEHFVSIYSLGEEMPVGAWFQLFQDTYDGVFYVREYGLRFATKNAAPPDAPTLTEFWKQKPAPSPAPKK